MVKPKQEMSTDSKTLTVFSCLNKRYATPEAAAAKARRRVRVSSSSRAPSIELYFDGFDKSIIE
eukprot:CAMPEP_0197292592 /NCGR_PEP_ID=MMETSP0890-20130614/24189_1 /TAXON_ID=44058 ORGANISM="Aureoumbra lagunensis, Strain CCMP1510" /NCGR_SAMPLE_ID=MMETSP0890 /ASSEMBLY_ACC=CAM_ASM_000533 /LENGTH=63 /DNA_ID=CAMNT_0042766637 /DNA_START=500 /DNA_END=691 /DNA_ORIENTATION=-